MNEVLMLLPLLLPIVGALLITNKNLFAEDKLPYLVGSIVSINVLLVIYSLFFNEVTTVHLLKVNDFLDLYFRIDQLTRVFSLLASTLWILTAFYAFEYMKHETRHRQFYTFFTLTLAVILGVAYSGNLFTLYAYYEVLTLCTLPLVIHTGSSEALASGKKYIIYSFSGATLVILGMMMLYAVTGNMNFTSAGIFNTLLTDNTQLLRWSYLAMFLGFGVKAALVPFHSWLPNAMVAPTPVSALLHAVAVVKSGVFSLIRITYFIFGANMVRALDVTKILMPFVVITIVMGSLLALHQDHLKKRLAYSTISQLGYILMGILMLNPNGLLGAMLHLINHAVIKITLFFVVGSITYMTHHKYIYQIKGIGKRMPVTMVCYTIAAISLIGIPPTNGFVSKWFLGLGALAIHNLFYIIILLLSAFLTAAYLLPVSVTAFFDSSKEQLLRDEENHPVVRYATDEEINVMEQAGVLVTKAPEEDNIDPPKGMLFPIVMLTVTIIGLGIYPNAIIAFLNGVIQEAF